MRESDSLGIIAGFNAGARRSWPSNRISVNLAGLLDEVVGYQDIEYLWKSAVGSIPDGKSWDEVDALPVLIRVEKRVSKDHLCCSCRGTYVAS